MLNPVLLGLLLLTPITVPSTKVESTVNRPKQREIIVELQRLIGAHYVLDEGARQLIDGLQEAMDGGEFDASRSVGDFVALSNRVLQKAFPDRHLGILSPERYQEMKRRFQAADTDEAPSSGAGHSEAPSGHQPATPQDHPEASHAPSTAQANHSAGDTDALLDVAGVSRVAEINRDGLNQIGYLALKRFDGSPRAVAAIDRIFHTFSDSERLIIDLRECGGGEAAMVKVLSSYLFAKPTHLVSSIGPRNTYGDRPVMERWTAPNALSSRFSGKPVDVLISKKSFSAAESFAFGLKVTGRARLIGQASGGGGHMNDFFGLPGGLGASISVGRTYDPRTGKGWEREGVVPDVVTPIGHALSETITMITRESGKLAGMGAEQTAIYRTIQDYANAWYRGDGERMSGLLADEFQASHAGQANGRGDTLAPSPHRDRTAQVAATAAGSGVRPQLYHNRIISGIEIEGDRATASLVLRETIHTLTLFRGASGWLIASDTFRDKPQHG